MPYSLLPAWSTDGDVTAAVKTKITHEGKQSRGLKRAWLLSVVKTCSSPGRLNLYFLICEKIKFLIFFELLFVGLLVNLSFPPDCKLLKVE